MASSKVVYKVPADVQHRMDARVTEDVRGVIVGGDNAVPYEFWTEGNPPRPIVKGVRFESDEQAIAWFEKAHPAEFKRGVEVRCFDQ